jgi:hypothetical protein
MNTPKLDILTNQEKSDILTDITSLLSDSQFSVRVILGKKSEGDYNPGTGVKTETWTRDAIDAIRSNFTAMEASFWKGNIEVGDVVFLIKKDDYLADLGAELDKGDQILELRYDVGGVSMTGSSAAVTGSGTVWTTNAGKGDYFSLTHETDYYEISSVATNTSLTLTTNYANATKSWYPYQIFTDWQIVDIRKDLMDTIRKIHCRRIK